MLFKLFEKKRQFTLKSSGLSMFPILYDSDLVYYQKIKFSQIKINDLILIRKNKIFLTHRTIYKNNIYLITKGDNNPESDGKIYSRDILGKACQVKRSGKVVNPENIYLMQSTLYLQEIIEIKKAFNQAELDYLFLKGLPLHLFYEKTHPRRIYLDCDVLIDKNQLKTAIQILKRQGFKKIEKPLSQIQQKLKNKEVEFAYTKIINNFPVTFDLHLEPVFLMTELGELNELYPQKLLDQLTQELLNTKREIKINNNQFLILNSKFLILYLALHFFHHNYSGAFRLDFIDKVIRKSKLSKKQWGQLAMKIHEYHLQNYIYASFYLAKKLYKTPIPKSFLKSIKPSIFHLQYLSSILDHPSSIFNDQTRTQAGIERFKLLYHLSPNPWYCKCLIFLRPIVIHTIVWIFYKKSINLLKNTKRLF